MGFRLIRTKIIVSVVAGFGVALVVIMGLLGASWNRSVRDLGERALAEAREGLANLQGADGRMLSATLDALASDDKLRAAYQARDLEALGARARPLYARLNENHGITQLNWIDNDGTLFLRSQSSTRGDKVMRAVFTVAAQKNHVTVGPDLGKTGFSLRVVAPYQDDQGRRMGFMEIGEEFGHFLDKLKRQTGADYGLIVRKATLDPADYAATRGKLGLPNNWGEQPDYVVVNSTTPETETLAAHSSLDGMDDKGRALGVRDEGGRALFRGITPIVDASGQRIGAIVIVRDVSAAYHAALVMRREVLGVISALMLALCVAVIALAQRLVFSRLQTIISRTTRVVGGDYDTEIPVTQPDEMGELERLIDQLRVVFVSTVREATRGSSEGLVSTSLPAPGKGAVG